jgi:di/tricarboxylate transporter
VSFENLLVLGITLAIAIVLITDKLRADVAALLTLVILGLTGLVSPDQLFSGFGRPAVITILALFMITQGLERSGATRILGRQLGRLAGTSEARAVVTVMVATALLSLVMNTIAAAAVLLPAVIGISRQTDLKPSRLLIPLSFASLLGGMATLFTTANLLVSASLAQAGFRPYGILDFIPVGLPMAVAGILFMALVGRKLLPQHSLGGERHPVRPAGSLADTYELSQAVTGAYVMPGSEMAGLSLAEGGWGTRLGLSVVGISRGGSIRLAPSARDKVLEGDVVIFTGHIDDAAISQYRLVSTSDPAWHGKFTSSKVSLVEAVLAPRSAFAGKTLHEINFREKYDLMILALWRAGRTIRIGLADIPLEVGDALLIQGSRERINILRNELAFIVLEENIEEAPPGRKAWLAVGLTTAAVVMSALQILPIAEAAVSAALLMVLLGCMTMDEAYNAVEWRAIFLIASMLPLGIAMTTTGTAKLSGDALIALLGHGGPLALAAGIFLVTTLLTQVMGGQATAVVLAPIAIAAASTLGADPRAIGMAVAMGCSTAFLTPFGHPSNILVMGPGGYTTRDYARVGLPLTLVLFITFLASLMVMLTVR